MKVKYIGCSEHQANFGKCNDPRGLLTEWQKYELINKEVHSFHTLYYLQGFEDYGFNSVCFVDTFD